eukprot:jgi/Ulvmu1/9370/UM050_0122.1
MAIDVSDRCGRQHKRVCDQARHQHGPAAGWTCAAARRRFKSRLETESTSSQPQPVTIEIIHTQLQRKKEKPESCSQVSAEGVTRTLPVTFQSYTLFHGWP